MSEMHFAEVHTMEKKKENAAPNGRKKLNDELLDNVAGGGGWGESAPLRCSHCRYASDDPKYSAGQECPSCHNGVLF